jgi:CheY-like chemotaxis protein
VVRKRAQDLGVQQEGEQRAVALRHPGTETVLVADDEPMVLQCVAGALRDAGYRVLEAEGGADALALARSHPGPIHLLLTDVVMPGIRGPELAARVQARRPETRVLFMSAEPCGAFPQASPHALALGKPFVLEDLANAVRAALDAAPTSQPPDQRSLPLSPG